MSSFSLYLVEDEPEVREGLVMALGEEYQIKAFADAESALAALKDKRPDLVLMDIGLPRMNGLEALKVMKAQYPEQQVIMITANEDVESVVAAMKLGAHNYIPKPVQMNALMVTLRNALETTTLRSELQKLHERCLQEDMPFFVGGSSVMHHVMDVVAKVAKSSDTPILILGETGTGKELIAKAIHYRSPNARGSMVSINCAAIPRELIESELFGYEKGAFSGAGSSGKEGMVEKAAGGTLFLDEVGDLSAEAQSKLLRFLEAGDYYRVGGTQKRTVRTRIVSATNRALEQMMINGDFRRDLYYRLAVVSIEIPSLNNRREDILPIARHFLSEFNEKFGKSFKRLSTEAESALTNFNYTGNIRELKNLIEREVLLSDGDELSISNFPFLNNTPVPGFRANDGAAGLPPLTPEGVDFEALIKRIEKQYLEQALLMTHGNDSRAAKLLGLSRDTFRYRKKAN